ncbi:unnamed protein product [Brassicogethes aeneus]|uniref:Uncharacterized protein n=1 Tax=Brassicogethes aeneus TaxID=1431903 RepID=A0A9P0B3G9_BRAAE|nr:unnamed protein product [Brassicogethes aeneus]
MAKLISIFCCFFIFYSKVNCKNETYNFLLFTQRWAPGACKEWLDMNETNSCYDVPHTHWTIHGLWPEWNIYCNDNPLDMSQLLNFEELLTQLWPTTRNLTNQLFNDCVTFWSHEWEKHGTCAMALPQFNTINKYFLQNLSWNLEYDVYTSLEINGITPDSNRGYKFADIRTALINSFGKIPDIICTTDNLINEVRLCFDLESNLIDCTVIQSNCNIDKDVLYR